MRQIAEDVLKERYYQPGETCWRDVALRVSEFIGNIDESRDEYYKAISNLEIIPNSPALMNAGTSNPQMSACFCIPIEDSIESIFDAVKYAAIIHKSGGGTGFNFSDIRAKGTEVKGTGHMACLTGDTVVYTNDKKIIKKQQITIGELYERKQKGRNLPKKLRCMLDDYAIGKNELIDIIYSGIDTVYELKTELGYVIRATSDHRFLGINEKWVKVKNISVGDSLAVNGNELNTSTCIRCGKLRKVRGERSKYAGMCENCVVSVFNGCSLKGSEEFHVKMSKASSGKWNDELRQKMRSRFIGENNDYFKGSDASETTARGRIRTWYPDLNLDICCVCGNTVQKGADIEIHHIDENPYNNSIDNLQIICTKCHGKIHKRLRSFGNPRLFKEITFDKVISIVECGKEPVYDIQMKYPYNNFIANGFVSHNSGPVSFMHVFNSATETIKQGGKRRGANLGALDVTHPDIKEFITCKNKEGELSNFNISVNITDEFMKNPDPEIWDLIVDGNWNNGEPGILFQDTAERDNKRSDLGKLKYRNPCTEVCLLAWESCNLASINLMSCCDDGEFNWCKFEDLVRLGVRFLNDMIDKNLYPLPQIEEATKKTRKIGLGVMGFADLLIALGMRYGDDESLKFVDDLFDDMRDVAECESESIGGNNAALLSIAPTGSISLFAGVSSGIEPNFGYVYNRSTWASGEKTTYREVHPMFEEWMKSNFNEHDYNAAMNHMERYGTLNNSIEKRGSEIEACKLFVTAKDISPMDHVRMQATIQKHVDQAISKTINCPAETTKEEISDLIKFAWESGCKGLTIYREGSRSDVVLETNATKQIEEKTEQISLPKIAEAKRIRMKSACGVLWVNVVFAGDNPVEVFITTEGGGCTANISYIGRLISKMLQNGVDYEVACKQGDKVICSACAKNKNGDAEGLSCAALIADAIRTAVALKKSELSQLEMMSRFKHETTEFPIEMNNGYLCPYCGAKLIHIDGCVSCTCGYSRCK